MRSTWTQPACDLCWLSVYPGREPTRIVGGLGEEETCAFCGASTSSGIYVRVDPSTVPFPRERDA